MDHGDEETEVELGSLWETGMGGLEWRNPLKGLRYVCEGGALMIKNLKKVWDVSLRAVISKRGEEEYMGRGGGGGGRWWGDFNDKNPF